MSYCPTIFIDTYSYEDEQYVIMVIV